MTGRTKAKTPEGEIARYLHTGGHDSTFSAWHGDTIVHQHRAGTDALLAALIAEVRRRAGGKKPRASVPDIDLRGFARRRLGHMVRGFFPAAEEEPVLAMLEKSIVFLTPENIESVLSGAGFPKTAWDLANLYLLSLGAEPLRGDGDEIVGMGVGATCYVSTDYFGDNNAKFADFVVHEAAHTFHNCKRRTVGLQETRTKEWLVELEFKKRETFAYACEAYSRILELGPTRADRHRLLAELERGPMPNDKRVDTDEYVSILQEAVRAKNGWKRILERCQPR